MSLIIFSLICLSWTKFFIQPTACVTSTNIQNFESSDIISLWDQFPSVVDKIKETVNRLQCPKGWKRVGGSCYYLSPLTSAPTNSNYTCNQLHSDRSNLMQIRNAVELFYATHVLSRNNFTSMMIEIDSNLLRGKKIVDILTDDQDRWNRMKQQLIRTRTRYHYSTRKILDRLNSSGLRIMRRSRKVKPSTKQYNSNDSVVIINSSVNNTDDDEYEYDDLDLPDESDEFEQLENIRGICNQIDWSVLNNNSSVYILSTYIVSNKIVCSLSDVEPGIEYHHICEYVLDFCFANIICGKQGYCVNTLSGFKCSCSFLFGGLFCDRISQEGQEIILGIIIILSLYGILFKPVRRFLFYIIESLIKLCRKVCQTIQKRKNEENDNNQAISDDNTNNQVPLIVITHDEQSRRETMLKTTKVQQPLENPIKSNRIRSILSGILIIFFLSLLLIMITARYWRLFNSDRIYDTDIKFSSNMTKTAILLNETIHLVKLCKSISDHRTENLIFVPFSIALILTFCFSITRQKNCPHFYHGRPGFIPPIQPFRIANRFSTATVFGILAYEVLKIFEELLFGSSHTLNHGVLVELIIKIATIVVAGLRYYPILASLQLSNVVTRFLTCLYMTGNIFYTIHREGSCMGFIPLPGKYTILDEAKLRIELGTWFIIYGLIKNIPHYFFLSFTTAELWIRLLYDSVYVQIKKNKSICSALDEQLDEAEFSKYHVTKLFRQKYQSYQITTESSTSEEETKKDDESIFRKLIHYIYTWDDDFRFTTMVISTYTVAFVFLYYLTCTFIFLNISRTTGHVLFLKSYIESSAKHEIKGRFSLDLEIIISGIITFLLFGFQLINGMQLFKDHKIKLLKGICDDIPPMSNFKPSKIAADSVHYSGFLVGYMAWGFVICFHLILTLSIGIRAISLQIRHIEVVLAIVVPILVIYLLKMTSMKSAGKFLFIQKLDKNLNLKNPKTYAVFLYFIFFADCFLGIASCVIRLIKAVFFNIIYMARLDYSFFGRPLEKTDVGFAAYASYLHMEIKQTHLIRFAFCYSLLNVTNGRIRKYYDEECCTFVSDLDDDDAFEERKKTEFQQNRTNTISNTCRRQNTNDESIENIIHETHELQSVIKYTPLHLQESESLFPSSIYVDNSTQDKSNSNTHKEDLWIDESALLFIYQHQPRTTDMNIRMTDVKRPTQTFTAPIKQNFPTKPNQSEDESDEDGGIKVKSKSKNTKIPSQQTRLAAPPAQLSKINTNNQIDDDDEDEDGGVNMKKIIKQKREAEEKKKKKQSITKQNLDDEDEDGGIIPKQKPTKSKTNKKSLFTKCIHNKDEDGGQSNQKSSAATKQDNDANNVLKREESIKQKKEKKDLHDENEDEDGGLIVKNYDMIKRIIPTKQPVLDNRTIKQKTVSESTDDDGNMEPSKRKKEIPPASYDTIRKIVVEVPNDIAKPEVKKTKDKHKKKRDSKQKEPHTPITTTKTSSSRPHEPTFLRRTSYCEAQEHKLSVLSQQSNISSATCNQNNDESYYAEIKHHNKIQTGFINRLYSMIGFTPSSSDHSSKGVSVRTLTSNQISEEEKERIKRRKIARNRWFLAYTIIKTPHLFDLRKDAKERLIYVRSQKPAFSPELEFTALEDDLQPVNTIIDSAPKALKMQRISENTTILTDSQQSKVLRPVLAFNSEEGPQSEAEKYIANRCYMLCNATHEQRTTLRSASFPPGQQENLHPGINHTLSTSHHSTYDCQISGASSTARSSVLCAPKTHEQFMKEWYERKSRNFQRKRRHSYVYGPPPRSYFPR